MGKQKIILLAALVVLVATLSLVTNNVKKIVTENKIASEEFKCVLTKTDALGPYYIPNIPERAVTGDGKLTITGRVISWPECLPVPNAKIEFWQAGADGRYTDDQRSAVYADNTGSFYYRSSFPGVYEARPVHIHVKISSNKLNDLVTQIYPEGKLMETQVIRDFVALSSDAIAPNGYDVEAPNLPIR